MVELDEGLINKVDSEFEDECEVLEESFCGRWQKRCEEVKFVNKKYIYILYIYIKIIIIY